MKSQAQYCTFEKVKRSAPGKFQLLAKLAIQASEFYGKAYSIASTPPVVKVADPKNFVSILQFNEYSFLAQAYSNMACHYEKQCEQTTEGIGKAIANIRKASEYIEILKKMEKFLSPTILSQYRDLSRFIIDKRKYLEDQNNKIYHEMVSTKVDEIEGINYGNPTPIDTELSRPFEGQEVFSRMIPPAVKMLEEEFKNEVGSVLNNAFSIAQRIDMDQDKLFMKYNLPACLHAVSGEQNIPEDLWVRIKSCKEKGGVTGLSQMIQSLHTMSENNLSQVST